MNGRLPALELVERVSGAEDVERAPHDLVALGLVARVEPQEPLTDLVHQAPHLPE